jgi:hypothetical protein
MQLLLKRGQCDTSPGFIQFDLWAKFELTSDEDALVKKYRVRNAILSEGDARRDINRAIRFAALPALLVAVIYPFFVSVSLTADLFLGIAVFIILAYGIYQQIREEIRVSDIIDGRTFKCKSVVTLIEKERIINVMAGAFRDLLEAMKTWGGTEAIPTEPQPKSALQPFEQKNAAA